MKKKILAHFDFLYTPQDKGESVKGTKMNDVLVIEDAYIVIEDGIITKVGSGDDYTSLIDRNTLVRDHSGSIAVPGFVDSHTHLVHGGSREHEFGQKLNGVSYLEILNAGGGIISTVRSTRNASFDELYHKAEKALDDMLLLGTTTVEAKSGYGLDLENEKKQLAVAQKLNEDHPVDLVGTFMGAHAIAPEYKNDKQAYIDLIIHEMLPQIKESGLAEFCDIFCEDGIFEVEDSRAILEAAKKLGFKVKIHADEIISLGGAELSAEVQTISAEHLMAASDKGIRMMGQAKVIANLLPATTFSLMKNTYAPARKMIENNVAVAISSDYNPGSCPSSNLQFAMQLGCLYLRMTPFEVLTATTLNGAYAIDRGNEIGSLEVGKKADIAILDAPNLDYVYYHFGKNHIKDVYKNGELVVSSKQAVYK
ncbi:MAG: imidazolonepropionase [Peptostreptococcaceae bacterium]|nr:imidazolonepropionase [Peptostreptococcaceae bacterium]